MASSDPAPLDNDKYPYPVNVNVRDFVPINLSNGNYFVWKTLMLHLIESQHLDGFINGVVSAPPEKIMVPDDDDDAADDDDSSSDGTKEIENQDYQDWKRSDVLLQRWIIGTINEDVLPDVVYLQTAKDMWERLTVLQKTNLAYPYPTEVNVGDFVPFKLSRSNYLSWRRLMLRLFENQGLLDFILPQDNMIIRSVDSLAWKRTDALLQSWILRTINENFVGYVVELETAGEMWIKLESVFTYSFETITDYPYPVEVNVGDYVPVKLSRENYSLWRKLMYRLFERQCVVGFITNKLRVPPKRITITDENSSTNHRREIYNPNYKAWKRTDELLQTWIMGTINQKDVLACVVDLKTAHQIWTKLFRIFTSQITSTSTENDDETEDPISQYLPLHKAALTGDWEKAKEYIKQKPDAVRAFITRINETALMVAVRSSARGNHFVINLLKSMSQKDLALRDTTGWTALHYAAVAGNTEAAKLLVDKNPLLPNYCDDTDDSPLRKAATFGGRKMVVYLLDVTKEDTVPKPFEGEIGAELVKDLILSGLYDIALSLIQRYPKLAWEQSYPALEIIALNCSSAFKSEAYLNGWQSLVFSYVPTKLEAAFPCCGGDVENPTNTSFFSGKKDLPDVIWKVMSTFVPQMKDIRERKLKHEQALQLVKHLCREGSKLNYSKVEKIFKQCLMEAANFGIPEVVEEIIEVFPELVHHKNEMKQNIFHVAILNRCEDVFNLIYQFRKEVRHLILTYRDSNGKSCLDLVVELKKEQKLNLRTSAAGAALQMQRELQWFQEVEKHTIDYYKEFRTKERTTSGTIYTDTHEELIKEGEKWMKDTSTSCTIIAALIATVVFAAAITVPGGNDGNSGLPILYQSMAFTIFINSDAIALFSSISSVLMFLAILTSRYSITDFLFTLPNKLIIGLLSLFVSIISMMLAFAATLYLVFGHKGSWILFPIIIFSCFPVTVFMNSQFPLLWDMMISTYGRGIFRQRSNRILF